VKTNHRVKYIRCDDAGENRKQQNYVSRKGRMYNLSSHHQEHHRGMAELRENLQHIMEE
jgi:hypothetical protein